MLLCSKYTITLFPFYRSAKYLAMACVYTIARYEISDYDELLEQKKFPDRSLSQSIQMSEEKIICFL